MKRSPAILAGIWLCVGLLPTPAAAVDGVIEINQARALAGGVSAGDAPGFPVEIYASGSYRLTGDLSAAGASAAIQIDAADVTLDLGGFTISNAGGSTTGIRSLTGQRLTVRNGRVRDFDGDGVLLALHSSIEGVTSTGNGGDGIECLQACAIRDGIAASNGSSGIGCGTDCVVQGMLARQNTAEGIRAGARSRVVDCSAAENGSEGIEVDSRGVVASNVSWQNGGAGIYAGDGTLVRDNSSTNNTGYGLESAPFATFVGYRGNVFINNNMGTSNPQAFGGTDLGDNLCAAGCS